MIQNTTRTGKFLLCVGGPLNGKRWSCYDDELPSEDSAKSATEQKDRFIHYSDEGARTLHEQYRPEFIGLSASGLTLTGWCWRWDGLTDAGFYATIREIIVDAAAQPEEMAPA